MKTSILPGHKEGILSQPINNIAGTGSHKQGETVRYKKDGDFYFYMSQQNTGLVRSKGNYIN